MIREIVAKTDHGVVSVEIGTNGHIEISRVEEKDDSLDGAKSAAARVWLMHLNWTEGHKVIRSGSGYCGIYPFNPDRPILNDYVETDTIHASSCEEWAINVFRFYMDLFSIKEQYRIIRFLRYHDLGEKVDLADDRPRTQKFKDELELFIKRIQYLSEDAQTQLIRDFVIFENAKDSHWDKRDQEIMQFAKLCDKADAPLTALLYEKEGRGGSLLYKEKFFEELTKQDKENIKIAGTSAQADAWLVHLIDGYNSYYGFDIFLDIIVAACHDVRGEGFPWLYGYLEKKKIFTHPLKLKKYI